MERDYLFFDNWYSPCNFNSHAHVERDIVCAFCTFPCVYFNSPAHVERDDNLIVKSNKYSISTHTLTWSVTNMLNNRQQAVDNFNSHAHVERDKNFLRYAIGKINFNSHAHVERDT